jgi:uncharacterized membrane protein
MAKQRVAQSDSLRDRVERLPKQPLTPVAGPYGHPFHPILVTIPIGAWVASFVFDLIAKSADDPRPYALGAKALIGIGVLGAAAAAVFGFLDFLTIPGGTRAFKTGLTHMALNTTVLVVFIASFFMRSGDEPSTGLVLLSAVALVVLSVSGFLGGKMTYRYGVRVAEERDQLEGF